MATITRLSQSQIGILFITLVWAIIQRYIWVSPWLERFLDIDENLVQV